MESIASLNQAGVAAAKGGKASDHAAALRFFARALERVQSHHTTHPQLFVTHSNKAASHLALGQFAEALTDASSAVQLLTAAAAAAGLPAPDRHPHWPKACLRLGQAFLGLRQHKQAAAAFEAGLGADPAHAQLKAGLQAAQQRLAADALSGTAASLLHHKALPAPPTPQRITLVPHNGTAGAARAAAAAGAARSLGGGRRGHAVGWADGRDHAAALVAAAADVAASLPNNLDAAPAGATSIQQPLPLPGEARALQAASDGLQLPRQLLTPSAAAADPALRDVFDYLTVQCDIRAPQHYLRRVLPDGPRMSAWCAATAAAVQATRASGRTPRVLLLGAKAGLLAIAAVRAGAAHVTCVESCPYLAAACRRVLAANGVPADTAAVVCSRSPAALRLGASGVPAVCCNVLVADLVDDGVLSGGLLPAVAHALDALLVREAPAIVPQVVSVLAQAVGVRPAGGPGVPRAAATGGGGGGDDGAGGLERHRWTPSQALPAPLDPGLLLPLSGPARVWHLPAADMAADRTGVQVLDLELTQRGSWAAVAFWAELQLWGDITISTNRGPQHPAAGSSACSPPPSQQVALCWLPGALAVEAGDVFPLVAAHNTVRLSFGLREADYSWLFVQDPSFPHAAFAGAADERRLAAYAAALRATMQAAAAAKLAAAAPAAGAVNGDAGQLPAEVQLTVLDVGCGSGALSLLAACALDGGSSGLAPETAGEAPRLHTSVVGVELVAPLAAAAQRAVAAAGGAASERVVIVHGDAASLARGAGPVPAAGVDVIVADVFDASLVGHGCLGLLEVVMARLAAAGGAAIIPASASLYTMGVELLTAGGSSLGAGAALDLTALDGFQRMSDEPEAVLLHHVPHKRLTAAVHLGCFDFCGVQPGGSSDSTGGSNGLSYPREMPAALEVVAPGRLTCLVVWFDLHLAEGVSITSAPAGFTTGGRPLAASEAGAAATESHHWGQGLHHLDVTTDVLPGDEVSIMVTRDGPKLRCELAGAARPRPEAAAAAVSDVDSTATRLPLSAAPRPAWLRPGAGVEDAAVWSVARCQQLLGQMLLRAPGARFPPVWTDLALMQLHAGSLGLDAAVVGGASQELALREALSAASQRQVRLSPVALPEAAGLQPPLLWR